MLGGITEFYIIKRLIAVRNLISDMKDELLFIHKLKISIKFTATFIYV